MNTKLLIVKRLREAAVKAGARVSAAKGDLKAVKSRFKLARKLLKAEKKAAKQLRRKLKEAVAATFVRRPKPAAAAVVRKKTPKRPVSTQRPADKQRPAGKKSPARKKPRAPVEPPVKKSLTRRAPKPKAKQAPETLRSAAEVAKSVIERLHSPPPLLPPTPVIPQNTGSAEGIES